MFEESPQENLLIDLPEKYRIHKGPKESGEYTVDDLENHHLSYLMYGHPQAISQYACILKDNRTLGELYRQMLKEFKPDNFMGEMGEFDLTFSLKVSLETSTKYFRQHRPQAIELYGLLGMMHGGLFEDELNEVYKDGNWTQNMEALRNASLVNDR